MKREELVARNLRVSAARHSVSPRQKARQAMLRSLARMPVAPTLVDVQQRILLIRPDHMGDALLTLPAITALRTAFPGAELHALASPQAASVFASVPELDAVQTMDFPGISRSARRGRLAPWLLALGTARQLRNLRFSAALILRPDHWWGALVAWLAGIPQRIGLDLAETTPFLTHAVPLRHEHALLRNLRLVAAPDGQAVNESAKLCFPLTAADRDAAAVILRENGVSPDAPYLFIHPGTGAALKHWEEARWARVADEPGVLPGTQVLFSGSTAERSLVKRITAQMQQPATSLAGKTSIAELAACYENALLVLGPDSGPLHLAAAVGAPTVSLYGPADPAEFGPWGPAERHITLASNIGCRPCRVLDWDGDDAAWHPCLRDISVNQVVETARNLCACTPQSPVPVK